MHTLFDNLFEWGEEGGGEEKEEWIGWDFEVYDLPIVAVDELCFNWKNENKRKGEKLVSDEKYNNFYALLLDWILVIGLCCISVFFF